MKKFLSLALVFAIVLAFAVPAMAAAPNGFITGDVTQIEKKGYDSFAGKEITSNNSVTQFDDFNFVADNKTFNAWYIDVLDDLSGTLEVAYKSSSNYYTVVFDVDGAGKYWIGDSKGSNGTNMVKVGVFTVHIHGYTPVITPPECKEDGYTTYTCDCGDSYIDDIVPALGHISPFPTITKQPTCTEPGQTIWYCIVCGDTNTIKNTEPPAFGHDLNSVTVDASCTEDGSITVTCSRCDYEDITVLPAIGHNYDMDKDNSAYYTPPTYEADGFWTFPCLNPDCDSTIVEQDAGSMLIHTHVYVIDATVVATNPSRITYVGGDKDGQYLWSCTVTITLYLSDGSVNVYTFSDSARIETIPSEQYNPDQTVNSWYYPTFMYSGLDVCKDITVYLTTWYTYADGVVEVDLTDVYFEIGDDWICEF